MVGSSDDLTGINRLHESAVYKLDDDSVIGILHLEADTLFTELTINRDVAKNLRNALDAFLKGDAAPIPERQN